MIMSAGKYNLGIHDDAATEFRNRYHQNHKMLQRDGSFKLLQ